MQVRATLARYEELQDLIAILGMEELSLSDQQTVIRARRSLRATPAIALVALLVFVGLGLVLLHRPAALDRLDEERAGVRSAKLVALRLQEDEALHRSGWIDRERGIARIPIDDAIPLAAQRLATKSPRPAGLIQPLPPAAAPAADAPAPAPAGTTQQSTAPAVSPPTAQAPAPVAAPAPSTPAAPPATPAAMPAAAPTSPATPAAAPVAAPAAGPVATPVTAPPAPGAGTPQTVRAARPAAVAPVTGRTGPVVERQPTRPRSNPFSRLFGRRQSRQSKPDEGRRNR